MKTNLRTIAAALILTLSAANTKAQGICFLPATHFSTSIAPVSSATGDFNGDGKKDIVIANQTGSISLFIGTGTGSFAPAVNFGAGNQPYGIAVGDLNNDNKQDVIVTNLGNPNFFNVLLGTGTGSFGAVTSFSLNAKAKAVAVGFFNADANLDIALGASGTNSVTIMLGAGNGSFSTQTDFVLPANNVPMDLTLGDFNNDSNSDIAVTNYTASNLCVLLGTGTGSFGAATSVPTFTNPY